MYIDKIDDIVNECNNTYHTTVKMKPIDVNSSTDSDFGIENNKNYPKLEVHDHVKISEYKNISAKGYVPN